MARRKSSPEGTILMRNGRLMIKHRNYWQIYWSGQMIDDLRRYYPTTPNLELAEMLGCKIRALTDKATELGIHKDEKYITRQHRLAIGSMNYHNRKYGNKGMYGRGRQPSDHFFQKGMAALNRRAVRNLDTGEIYVSVKEAAQKLGVMPNTVTERCNHPGRRQRVKNRAKLEWVDPNGKTESRKAKGKRLKTKG